MPPREQSVKTTGAGGSLKRQRLSSASCNRNCFGLRLWTVTGIPSAPWQLVVSASNLTQRTASTVG